jgi:hypothetical protein
MSVDRATPCHDDAGQFISLSAFTEWVRLQGETAKLPDWGTIHRDLPHLIQPKPDQLRNRLFITHRWDSQEHPDPSGRQLRALQDLGSHYNYNGPNLCFWFDYMSLPQKPRVAVEKQIFARDARAQHLGELHCCASNVTDASRRRLCQPSSSV